MDPLWTPYISLSLIVFNESSVKMKNSKSKHDQSIERFDIHGTDGCINETKSNVTISNQVPEDNASLICQDAPSSVGLVQDMLNNLTLQESCHKDVHSKYNQQSRTSNKYILL